MICICTCSVVLLEVCARVYYEHVFQPYGQLAVLHSFYLILRWAVGSFIQWFVLLVIKLFFYLNLVKFRSRGHFKYEPWFLLSFPAFFTLWGFSGRFFLASVWSHSFIVGGCSALSLASSVIRPFFALGQTLPLPKTRLIWILQFIPPQVLNYNLSI